LKLLVEAVHAGVILVEVVIWVMEAIQVVVLQEEDLVVLRAAVLALLDICRHVAR
jgi:hypothetical protein